MPHPYFSHASIGLSTILFSFGLNAMFRPAAHLEALGFPAHTTSSDPATKKLNSALMRIWGIRNLAVSSLLGLIWATGDEKLMAKSLIVVTSLPITDGFVSRIVIGGGETQHWMFIPVLGVVSAGLFGWFD